MNHSSLPPRRPTGQSAQPQSRPARTTSQPSQAPLPRHTNQPPRQNAGYPPRIQQNAGQRPSAGAPRRPTREEIARRRAYLERKRAEEQRRRILHGILAAITGILLIVIIIIAVRACADFEDTPASADGESSSSAPHASTAPEDSTAPPETTVPSETDPPTPPPASASRPTADESTVMLTDEIDSGYAVLIAPESGRILAQKNAAERMYPASMTKVMTLLVAYENMDNLDDTFTVTSAIIDPLYRSGASLAGFSPGETVTLRDLLYGTVLPSGAEAAVSLAIHIAGSEEEFVTLMNEKAKELGLKDTHFTNCTGLHDADHYSTAVEIAMIMDCAMQHEVCRDILSTYQYTTPPTDKHPEGVAMTSTMLSRMYGDEPDGVTITAGKTGYTPEAGQCLVSYGTDDVTGEAFILVTSKAEGKFEPVFDAIEIYSDYAG